MRSELYWIGFLANLFFGVRFFLQWIQSERRGQSLVFRSFWYISFVGNLCMCLHGYIQLQYPICVTQGLNAVISWRNLNLMGKRVYKISTVFSLMLAAIVALSALFFFQEESAWMRAPTLPWNRAETTQISLLWHLLGFFGILLFASRYWLQWWFAEKHQKSFLGRSFWWISCIGALFSLSYALRLKDPVNILSFSLGLIPYLRNLVLLKKKQPSHKPSEKSAAIFFFAGEQSGDLLGANLLQALAPLTPAHELYGVGGVAMKEAGLKLTHSMERFQVMGFSSVLASLPRLYTDFQKIKREILAKNPKAVILIDYPDFNMFLAKSLRKKGYQGKLIHYVCPSVWAWRKKRIYHLEKTLDHLLAILPFEKSCFANSSLPVSYVGHPLVATIDHHNYDTTLSFKTPLIAIFPGSRPQEILLNLPLQLAAAKHLGASYQLAISVARPELLPLIQKYSDPSIQLVPSEKRYELMRAASCALATSGTIVLELGLHAVPTVVSYQLSSLNYLLGRYLFRVRLPFYTLVNIICNKEVFPEFIHKKLSSTVIAHALQQLMDSPHLCRLECSRLRQLLTEQNASENAAHTIQSLLL